MEKNKFYALVVLIFAAVYLLSNSAKEIFGMFNHGTEGEMLLPFFIIAVVFLLNFVIFNVAIKSAIPSFVIAIFFGLVGSSLLAPVIEKKEVLGAFVTFGATLILFGGGLEIHFHNFRKLVWKILVLSFVGLFLTAFLFSLFLYASGNYFSGVSVTVAVLLGAILASTDPAAIIPVLKNVRFKNNSIKDIVISESAVTDVTGTLLTVVFLGLLSSGVVFSTVASGYAELFSFSTGVTLFKEIFFGVASGALGFGLLHGFKILKHKQNGEHEADAAFFLFVPILTFIEATIFGGSGYLAAFVAGLIFAMAEHLKKTEAYFNHTVEGFLKPAIFLLLGALVDVKELIAYAPIGIAAGLVFMFVIRPLAVFVSLAPFKYFGKEKVNVREMLFISFVRETGAIPAVLLVTVASFGLKDVTGLVPIGMWVILATLIIEPPLTPWVAKKLGVGELIKN